jgi:hypothetical protein
MAWSWKSFWILFDVLLFGTYFLYSLALVDPFGLLQYSDGRYGTSFEFMLIMYPLLYWPMTLLLIGTLIARMVYWGQSWQSRKALWIACITVIVCNPVSAFMVPLRSPGYKAFLNGYQAWAETNVPVEAIRDWLATVDPKEFAAMKQYAYDSGTEECNWPELLVPLYPRVHSGYVAENEEGQRYLRLWGGGGFGHWGVTIGPKDAGFSPEEQFYRKLEQGVYVWCD